MRDVLRSLEEKGLIERKPQFGTCPRIIPHWNLLDDEELAWCCESMPQRRFNDSLLELRMVIEPMRLRLLQPVPTTRRFS